MDNVETTPPNQSGLELDLARLETVLRELTPRLRARVDFPDDEADAVAATMSLLRAMVVQAEAILALSRTTIAEAGASNLRTMFEAWCDLRFILDEAGRGNNGRRYRVFGLLELRDYLAATATSMDNHAREIAEVDGALAPYRKNRPALVDAAEVERTGKRPPPWTTRRASMLKALLDPGSTSPGPRASGSVAVVVGTPSDGVARAVSWDSRNTLQAALDATIDTDEAGQIRLNFRRRQIPAESGAFYCAMAARMLSNAWLKFAHAFKVDPAAD